jgi:hypothetical protein
MLVGVSGRALVASGLVLGCHAGGPEQRLPEPQLVAEHVLVVAGGAGSVFWIADEPTFPLTHRLVRDSQHVDEDDWGTGASERGHAFVVESEGVIAWGLTGAFATCGRVRRVAADGTAVDLAVWRGGQCRALVIDVGASDVLFETMEAAGDQEAVVVRRLDLMADTFETRFSLGPNRLGQVGRVGDTIVASLEPLVSPGPSRLVTFSRAMPTGWQVLAEVEGYVAGVAAEGDRVFWAEHLSMDPEPGVTTVRSAPVISASGAMTLARFENEQADAIARVGGETWIATTRHDGSHLVRVAAEGIVERYSVAYHARQLVSNGASLYALIETSAGNQLVVQPLH